MLGAKPIGQAPMAGDDGDKLGVGDFGICILRGPDGKIKQVTGF